MKTQYEKPDVEIVRFRSYEDTLLEGDINEGLSGDVDVEDDF